MADLDFTIDADTRRAQQSIQNLENKIGNFKKAATGNNTVNVDGTRATSVINSLQDKFKALTDRFKASNTVNVDTTRATANLKNLETASKGTGDSLKGLQSLFAGIGIATFLTQTGQLAKSLDDISRASGLSIAEVRGFQQAVSASGGTTDQANDALKDLVKNLGEAALGSKDMQSNFARVGVSLDDLRTKSEGQILRQVIDGLARIPDSATRSAIGMKILGDAFNRIDFSNVSSSIGGFTQQATGLAGSVEKITAAQKNMTTAFGNIQNATILAIAPIAEFLAKLKPEQIETFIVAVAKIGGALVAISVTVSAVSSLITALGAAFTVVAAIWASAKINALAVAAGVTSIGAAFTGVTAGLAAYGVTLKTVLTTKVGLSILLANLRPLLLALLIPFGKLAAIIAGVTAAIALLNKGVELLSGKSLGGWAKEVGKYLGIVKDDANKTASTLERLNIKPSTAGGGRGGQGGPTAEELAAYNAEQDKRKVAIEQEAAARRQVVDAWAAEKAAIDKIAATYQKNNQLSNERYQQETALLGMTAQARDLAQLKNAEETKYAAEILKLDDEIAKKKATGLEQDKQAADLLEGQRAKLKAAHSEQLAALDQITAAREREVRVINLKNFTDQQAAQNQQKLADIQNQIAKVGLPEYKKATLDMAAASKQAADAAIREEEARRGQKLDPAEKEKYYAAATKGLNDQIAAQERLTAAQEKYNQQQAISDFQTKSIIDNQSKIRSIQDDMAKSTMTDIERKYYDINSAARESARSAIEAENARRKAAGQAAMTAAEEAKYYEISSAQAKKLTEETMAQTEQSRKFSTGWTRAYKQYVEDAGNASKTAESLFKTATQGMEDAIIGFAKTGKFEWKGFVGSLAEELLRSEVKSLFADLMNWMTGKTTETTSVLGKLFNGVMGAGGQQGAGGGQSQGGGGSNPIGDILGGIGKVFGSNTGGGILESIGSGIKDIFGGFFANGGSLAAGKVGIVGERGPEMISGPANITPIQPTNVIYNINAVDAPSFKAMIAQDPSFIYAVTMQGAKGIPGGR